MIKVRWNGDEIKALIKATAKVALLDKSEQLITDEIVPRTPIATGALRRSIKVDEKEKSRDRIRVEISANTPYAHKMHEGLEFWNWSESGTGPKYLEVPIAQNADEVKREIAMRLAKVLD